MHLNNSFVVCQAYDVWAASYDHDVKGLLYVGNDATAKSSIGYIQNETTTLMLDVGAGKTISVLESTILGKEVGLDTRYIN